jgi:homoserine kinase
MPTPIASVEVPASSANLGSGFDCVAAALSLKLRADLFYGDEPGILLNAHGEGAPTADADPEANLLIRGFREGLRAAHGSADGSGAWRLEVSSMIPAARGLGSSAAAILAGVLLGATLGRQAPTPDAMLEIAAGLEGHPDNVAAALYGGFALAVGGEDRTLTLRRFRVPEAWIPVVFIAATESRTEEMRRALPAMVPHADAVHQAGRSALLATAIMTSDAGLLRMAMGDRLHQPYRLPHLPGASELIDVAYEHGAAGAAISGAGPSVLAICDSPISAHSVEKAWNAAGVRGMATRLRFDLAGARLTRASGE